MGSALLAGWSAEGLEASVIVDPAAAPTLGSDNRHTTVSEGAKIPTGFSPAAVILAIKPQLAEEAITSIAPFIGDAVVVSIMAGLTLNRLRHILPSASGIVRAMPNTPAAIGRGISVAVGDRQSTAEQRALCDRLLRACGGVAWVEEEGLLDAATAVSGSGPAYVFLLTELLEHAGIAEGLPPSLARHLARETVVGAAALLATSGKEASTLRVEVTSPKGTTEAALAVLMADDAWPRSLQEAVQAAARRSRMLGC